MSSGTAGTVVVLATLDTKLAPALELANLIAEMGASAVLIDLSIRSAVAMESQELTVIRAGDPNGAQSSDKKLNSMSATVKSAQSILRGLIEAGACAVVGLGGGQGTSLCLDVLKVAADVERVMVTTSPKGVAFNDATTGLVLVHSITDITGSNPYLSRCLASAAAAALGPNTYGRHDVRGPVVLMSMLGITTKGVQQTEAILQDHARVAVFHANGLGGLAMERTLAKGEVAAVLDFTTGELTSEVAGGSTTAGPSRLTTAGAKGIPQLVVPGGTDSIIVRGDGQDERFSGRKRIRHTDNIVLIRANGQEMARVGELTAERLNAGLGPAVVLIPQLGFSQHDQPGEAFFDPEADEEYLKALRRHAGPQIDIRTLPLHINDPSFADQAAEMLLDLAPNLRISHR